MIRFISIFVSMLMLFSAHALEDKKSPIEVKSQTLMVDYAKNTAKYLGDVKVRQNNLRINCENMTVFYKNNKNEDSVLNSGSIDRIDFDQNVSIYKDGKVANGDLGVFDPKKETITLSGNASLKDKENYLKADTVVYDTSKRIFRTTHSESSENKRVRVVLVED